MDEEMEKRVVDEKKGKRLVDEEMLKTVEEKRREYRKASERFEAVTSFLSRYSNGDSALNDDLKYLFRVCGGQPIQDVSAVWAVAYNRQIFEENGLEIPTSYAELCSVCDALIEAGIIPIYECVSDGWHHVCWTEKAIAATEADPEYPDKLNSNSAALVGAAQQIATGSNTLSSGASEAYSGSQSLTQGLGTYLSGVAAASSGSDRLVNEGTEAAESGAAELASGIKAYTEGADKISSGCRGCLEDPGDPLVDFCVRTAACHRAVDAVETSGSEGNEAGNQRMRAFIRLDQDKSAPAALVESSPFQTAAVSGAAPIIQRERAVVMEMAQGQVVDAQAAQGAQRD